MTLTLIERLNAILQLENYLALVITALATWVFYLLALRAISEERHRIFKRQFRRLSIKITIFSFIYALYQALKTQFIGGFDLEPVSIYIGIAAVFLAALLLIEILKTAAFEYFFSMSRKEGVPLLLVNVSSLILSLMIAGWLATTLLDLQLASLLTTSAVLSIVLGLALQDTLGNLFAAISLQIDKPFELDDWIEIKTGDEKISGQVKEISWRGTVLLAVTDEYITIPNRMIAQCQIVNFSGKQRPFYRGYFFRIPFGSDLAKVKSILLDSVREIPGVSSASPSLAIVTDTTDSWITLKVVYPITNYGSQYLIADQFYSNALKNLEALGIRLASPRLRLRLDAQSDVSPSICISPSSGIKSER